MQASKLGRAGAVRRLAALARQHQHHVGLARIAGRLAHRQALQGRAYRRAPRCPWNPAGAPNRSALAGRPAAPAPRGRCPARWPAAGTGRPARAAATAPRRPGDAAPAPTPRRRTARWAWAAAPCRRPPARSTALQRAGRVRIVSSADAASGGPICPRRGVRLPAPRDILGGTCAGPPPRASQRQRQGQRRPRYPQRAGHNRAPACAHAEGVGQMPGVTGATRAGQAAQCVGRNPSAAAAPPRDAARRPGCPHLQVIARRHVQFGRVVVRRERAVAQHVDVDIGVASLDAGMRIEGWSDRWRPMTGEGICRGAVAPRSSG